MEHQASGDENIRHGRPHKPCTLVSRWEQAALREGRTDDDDDRELLKFDEVHDDPASDRRGDTTDCQLVSGGYTELLSLRRTDCRNGQDGDDQRNDDVPGELR